VKQPSVQPTTVCPDPPAVPPGVKDVFVWLTGTAALSDFLFLVCYTNALTYLLTYLTWWHDRGGFFPFVSGEIETPPHPSWIWGEEQKGRKEGRVDEMESR